MQFPIKQTYYKIDITEKILNFSLKFLAYIALPLNIIIFFALKNSLCIIIKILPIFLSITVLALFFFRKRIELFEKLIIFIIVLFSAGIYTLVLGLIDMASLWFILSLIFSFFSKNKKLPFTIFILAFILTLTTGLLMISDNPYFPIDYGFENCQFACISIRIINFLIIGFLIFKILNMFFLTIQLYIEEILQKNIVLEQLKAAEQNEAEQNLKNQILKSNIEKQQLELEYKRKELTNAFSKILKFNKLLNILKKDISDQNYKSAIANLTAIQTNNYDIETFLIKFNDIYPDFLIKLKETYPILTDTEIKVSILITAGLKSSEIGNLLNVAETSIGKYRNRIRKKLNLENNTDISAHVFQKLKYNKINNLDSLSE